MCGLNLHGGNTGRTPKGRGSEWLTGKTFHHPQGLLFRFLFPQFPSFTLSQPPLSKMSPNGPTGVGAGVGGCMPVVLAAGTPWGTQLGRVGPASGSLADHTGGDESGSTGGIAAPGFAEGIHCDIVLGVALQGREGTRWGRVVALHHVEPVGSPGFIKFGTPDGRPDHLHSVAGHQHGVNVARTTGSWEQTRRGGGGQHRSRP